MNMDRDRDLKKLFDDPRIPEADLTGKVMKILHTQPKEKERFFVKYKVALTAFVGMMLMASTGYAAVQYHSLHNKDGEVVFETKPTAEMPNTESKEDRARFTAYYDLKEKVLKNGEAALFYMVANNPNHETYLGTKTTVYQNLSQLRDKITDDSIKIPDKVNGNYTFEQAEVMFENVHQVNPPSPKEKAAMTEKLRKQAEASKQGYAMMPVELTDEILIIYVTYQNGEDTIDMTITNLSGDKKAISFTDSESDKILVKGVEMLHTEHVRARSNNLTWIYESPDKEQKYSYSVSVNSDVVSTETLIKIAESYLGL